MKISHLPGRLVIYTDGANQHNWNIFTSLSQKLPSGWRGFHCRVKRNGAQSPSIQQLHSIDRVRLPDGSTTLIVLVARNFIPVNAGSSRAEADRRDGDYKIAVKEPVINPKGRYLNDVRTKHGILQRLERPEIKKCPDFTD